MDTLAYAFSDIFELGEGLLTGAKKKSNPKIRLSLWIILLLLFLAYCTFEIHPKWEPTTKNEPTLEYPTIVICPGPGYEAVALTCFYASTSTVADRSSFLCSSNSEGGCAVFNNDLNKLNTIANSNHSEPSVLQLGVELRDGGSQNTFYPAKVEFFSQDSNFTKYSMHTAQPSFIIGTASSYFVSIAEIQNQYRNGTIRTGYEAWVSSVPRSDSKISLNENTTLISLTFSSFEVSIEEQYVDFDWLQLVSLIGGAAAMAIFIHTFTLCFVSFGQKSAKKITTCLPKSNSPSSINSPIENEKNPLI